MKLYYLTDESEKSLCPFFSPVIISTSFISLVIIGVLFIIFWPWQDLHVFIGKNSTPISFFVTFSAALIINSYVNLRCGRGEMSGGSYMSSVYNDEVVTYEKENDFFKYGLVEFLLHTILMILPFFPIFILSASISGISSGIFMRAFSIVFTTSLLCRMFGFMVYLFRGRTSLSGYLLVRIFIIIFIFVTAPFAPGFNPILLIYELHKGLYNDGFNFINSYSFYMINIVFAIFILMIVNQILVRRYIKKEISV